MTVTELDERRPYTVVAYARHDREDGLSFEFLRSRVRYMDHRDYERKLYAELAYGLDDAAGIEHDGIEVVAYAKADDATSFEDSSYAVIAFEQATGRGVIEHVYDEIAESIQLW